MDSRTVSCPHCGQRNRVPAGGGGRPRCGSCRKWLPWIVSATDADFADVVEAATVPVLVDLWATWCGPCKMVSPVLERLAGERAGGMKLVKIDVDHAPALSQRFDVSAVPTLLLMDRGRVLARKSGAAPIAALRQWIDESLKT